MTAAFVLEEGLPMETLGSLVARMARAASWAGVRLVAGDTKVVERGHGDGCYIATTGAGIVAPGVDLGPHRVRPGDAVLVSGSLGDHGVAIMSSREGLVFETTITSDSAALWPLVEPLLKLGDALRCLRDATRGGLAAVLNEVARAARVGITFRDAAVPVRPEVQAACELLGLDPLAVANEGSASSSWRGKRPRRPCDRSGRTRSGARRSGSVRSAPNTRRWSSPARPSARCASFPSHWASNCRGSAELLDAVGLRVGSATAGLMSLAPARRRVPSEAPGGCASDLGSPTIFN